MKALKWILATLALLLVLIQLIRPAKTNPPVDPSRTIQAHAQVPSEVTAILERACYDCHSYETQWPWYSHVAPISWLITHDVNEAREEMLFSDWAAYAPDRADHMLEEICEVLEEDEMPLPIYRPLHPEAELTDADRRLLCDWSNAERARLAATQPDTLQPATPPDSLQTPPADSLP